MSDEEKLTLPLFADPFRLALGHRLRHPIGVVQRSYSCGWSCDCGPRRRHRVRDCHCLCVVFVCRLLACAAHALVSAALIDQAGEHAKHAQRTPRLRASQPSHLLLFCAEITRPEIRGRIVSFQQLAISTSLYLSTLLNLLTVMRRSRRNRTPFGPAVAVDLAS